jgi:hypothetical protein
MTRSEFQYTDEQWAAIRRELSRIGFDADTETIRVDDANYDGTDPHVPKNARKALEYMARGHFFISDILLPECETNRVNLKRVVAHSQRLRKAIAELGEWDRRYAADLTATLKCYEESCGRRNRKPDYEKEFDAIYSFVKQALRVYVAACAKVSPHKLPRYFIGNETGPTICFLYAASRPVLGNNGPTKEAIRIWLRRNSNEGYIHTDRAGKSRQKGLKESIEEFLRQNPDFAKKMGEPEPEPDPPFHYVYADMSLAMEYKKIEEAMSQALAPYPEAHAAAAARLRELEDPVTRRLKEGLLGRRHVNKR